MVLPESSECSFRCRKLTAGIEVLAGKKAEGLRERTRWQLKAIMTTDTAEKEMAVDD